MPPRQLVQAQRRFQARSRDPLTLRYWWLVPLQDTAAFLVWIAGFFGNTIVWRGRKYYLYPDGRFATIAK